MSEPLLVLEDVRAGYGDSVVLDDISFEVHQDGSLALLGRNGVGKSTLMLTIMGFTTMRRGTIFWRGSRISGLPSYRRARSGIAWVAQEREIFPSLTVEENLTVAARRGDWTLARVYDLFPRMAERRSFKGSQLSGGEQQMLAISRALMTNPSLLLLDEPFEGLAPLLIEELAHTIGRMRAELGTALILVEQHASLALSLTDHALVLERGHIVHRAPAQALLHDRETLERLIGLGVS